MNKFKYPLRDYCNKKNDCIGLLSEHLNEGSLSLLLGAGASSGFGLPAWKDLVEDCAKQAISSFTPKVGYTNAELKQIMDHVKKSASTNYIDIIKKNLYRKVSFNFSIARKDLLIAITSLFIGKVRGTVRNVINYNFDSVLEWYLAFNGLKVNVTTFEDLLFSFGDIDVIHLHGFIPHSNEYGPTSKEVVFSKKEFEDRQVGESYWKDMMNEFFRRNVFLAIGLSPISIADDICPYLRELLKWHERYGIRRLSPFGFAFLTDADDDQIDTIIEAGVIPCVIDKNDIPDAIFSISQSAMKKS
jgi:SIR2-like protein